MTEKNEERCACNGANLDRFIQPVILDILNRESMTGYGVIKKMPEYVTFAEAHPDATGVYRYLRMMKERGLIKQAEPEGAGDRKGEALIYSITPRGRGCLCSWIETLHSYAGRICCLTEQLEKK